MNREELIQQSEDCISRQALIKRIDNAEENFKVDNMDSISSGEENPFVDGVLSGVFDIRKMIVQAPSVTPIQKWIPTSERLPRQDECVDDVCKDYLIQDEYGDMRVATYTSYGWVPIDAIYALEDDVVAWQPLPKPYKVESEEKR